ncbi:triple qxxk/r motif-containing protein [Plakobranchus ocellatus]|uniref:Triple QxxK/R motif-containing protein n=1 Tax=Plakobranchus ocellatus TaxID=259542 RepID=A0AAV3Y4R3_9GAST|nr:triple qxxk/r motif-containing protein [Plakobranchus ocellatus]
MGKKDASGYNSQPVEQYRKQIGKQDWKKSRHAVKNMKNRSDQGNEATPQQIVIMIALVVLAMAGLYALLLWNVGGGLRQGGTDVPVT